MTDSEHDYSEPWPMFADEDEPWKDLDRLLKWEQKMETQAELGDAFGCTPSTISYWLDKARDEVEPDVPDEERKCAHFEACGNLTVSPKNDTCSVCMALIAERQRKFGTAVEMEGDDFSGMVDHISELRDLFGDYTEERQSAHDAQFENGSEDSTVEA